MDENRRGRQKVWIPLFFSLVLIGGMVLGFNLRDTLRSKRDISTLVDRNDRLEEIIDLINEKYVDTVDGNVLYKDAVAGILKHLDPHTVYIPAEDLQSVNEPLEGGFSGIGVEFSIFRDTIEVTSVVENGPADHAGVEIGDQLLMVGDSIVAGVNITSERIVHLLKGKQNSLVNVTMKRSDGVIKHFPITRDIIPIYSVDASIMLDSVTGFIKIDRFAATTYDEFSDALNKLIKQGARHFVLDVRDNPGGYLDAATSIIDEFLGNNKLLLYTKGAHSPKTEYRTEDKDPSQKGRLVVLIDESSASASEILAGAVQDWDRGVLIGRRTYGKGLVQEQYDMDDGSALRLTVAKYYTPSGRCIQRSFAKGKEAYEEDYESRFTNGTLTGNDTTAITDTQKYYTANHRVVYGGGGIKPDVYVPYDTSRISTTLVGIIFSDGVKSAIWEYYMHNRHSFAYKDIPSFDRQFNSEDQIIASYVRLLTPAEHTVANSILNKPANLEYFRREVKAQLARFLFRDNGYYAISIKDDEVVNKALKILHSDNYLDLINR